MTINNPKEYVDSLWDWSVLKGAFPRGITPSDLDGVVQIGKRLLFFETKGPNVKEINNGQLRLFQSASAHNNATVFMVWGLPGKPERLQIYHAGKVWPARNINLEGLREACQSWARLAEVI